MEQTTQGKIPDVIHDQCSALWQLMYFGFCRMVFRKHSYFKISQFSRVLFVFICLCPPDDIAACPWPSLYIPSFARKHGSLKVTLVQKATDCDLEYLNAAYILTSQ